MTASELRARFGPPLARETFVVYPGFEIVVDYAENQQVRKIEFPGTAPSLDGSGASTPQGVDEVLLELVPMSVRGEQIGGGTRRVGVFSKHMIYEHVMIVEYKDPWVPDQRDRVTVFFNAHYQSSSTS
jgi:hypothetical protein